MLSNTSSNFMTQAILRGMSQGSFGLPNQISIRAICKSLKDLVGPTLCVEYLFLYFWGS
jgi:hypothetical protein